VDFANRASGVGQSYKFTGQQLSALGAAFLDAKVGVEEAGTATNAALMILGTASKKMPKVAQSALKSLGLTPDGMAKAMRKDGPRAWDMFLQRVAKSKDPMRALSAIFGKEHAPKIARLVNNLGRYNMALDTVSKAENYQGSTEEEYAARAETTANNILLLQNSVAKLGITIGTALLPPLNSILTKVTPNISAFADWAAAHEGLTRGVMGAVGAFAAFKVVGLASAYAISGFRSLSLGVQLRMESLGRGMAFFRRGAQRAAGLFRISWGQAFAPVRAGLASLRASVTSTAARLRALGAAGIAAGVKAKVAGAMASVSSAGWRVLRTGIRGVGMAFKMAFGPVGLLMTALSFGVEYLMENWDKIEPYFTALWDGVKDVFNKALEWMQPIFDKVGAAFDKLGEAWDWVFGKDGDEKKTAAVEPVAQKAAVKAEQRAAVQKKDDFSSRVAEKAGVPTPAKSAAAPAKSSPASGASGMQFTLIVPINADTDETFARRVFNALHNRQGDFVSLVSSIVHDQARVSYGY
jgi:phage-related tail protein